MPKTAVEEAICNICGAEVREASLFCYNCGGSVSKTEELEAIPVPAEPIVAVEDKPKNGNAPFDAAKRRTDRAEKRKVRAANRLPVEIVWEPRTGFSWPFVIVSFVFFLIAVGVIIAAFYVR